MTTNLKKFNCDLRLDETGSMYEVDAFVDAYKAIEKYLTLRDKSAGYLIRQKSDYLKNSRQWDNESDEEFKERIRAIRQEIKDLKEIEVQEFYQYNEHGKMLIPSGLWGIGNVINDEHLNTDIAPFCVDGLRDYQQEAVIEVLKYKKSMGVLATGLGKARIIASIAVSAVRSGKNVFVVVPTEYLVGQLYDTIKMFHGSVTAGGGNRTPDMGAEITVCTAQSARKYMHRQEVLIFDEAGHIAANTWSDIATHESFRHVYSFTATPFRADGLDLAIFALGGPIVYMKTVRWGINNGWLSPCQVHILNIEIKNEWGQPYQMPKKAMRTTAYKKMVGHPQVLSLLRGQVVRAIEKGERVMVIFKTLDPAKKFRDMCKQVLKFDVATATYKKPLRDFAESKSPILVATDKLISEGVDIPSATVLFLLTQNSSNSTTYQAVGRVLRKAEGKVAKVVDFAIMGYDQFERSKQHRLGVYLDITDNVKEVKV